MYVVLGHVNPAPNEVQQRCRQLGDEQREAALFGASAAQIMRHVDRFVRRQCGDDEAGHSKQQQHQQRGKQCAQAIPLPGRKQHFLVYRIKDHR